MSNSVHEACLLNLETLSIPSRILCWSLTSNTSLFLRLEEQGHTLTQLDTHCLTHYVTHSSKAPAKLTTEEQWDLVLFDGMTGEANILAGLHLAHKAIGDDGRILIRFSEDRQPPRLPRWREFWISIAERIGLTVINRNENTLLLARAMMQPRWMLKLADETDINAIKTLFQHVFQCEMSDALWNWKYGEGRGTAVLAYRDGALVAHYGAMFRSIQLGGEKATALQSCDVMVHPSERAVFTRQGIFFLMAVTGAEMYGSLNFGFPNTRHMRLGKSLGIYASAGRLVEARWNTSSQTSWHPPRYEEIRHADEKFADVTERLWYAMRRDLPKASMGVRDWAWLIHRYIQHPTHRYDIILARSRWLRQPVGIIVLRKHDHAVEVMDMISPIKSFPALLDAARHYCREWNKTILFGWFCETFLEKAGLSPSEIIGLDVEIPTDAWTKTEQADRIIETWWITSGDTDFR